MSKTTKLIIGKASSKLAKKACQSRKIREKSEKSKEKKALKPEVLSRLITNFMAGTKAPAVARVNKPKTKSRLFRLIFWLSKSSLDIIFTNKFEEALGVSRF